MDTNDSGKQAEARAAFFLQQHGLVLLQQNFHSRFGEIDLVMREGATLVFVEVRMRSNSRYGGAAESVTRQKQQKILQAAKYYLLGREDECRFDVVAIDGGHLEWIRDAFGE